MLPVKCIYRTRTQRMPDTLGECHLWIPFCGTLGFDFPKDRQQYLESTEIAVKQRKCWFLFTCQFLLPAIPEAGTRSRTTGQIRMAVNHTRLSEERQNVAYIPTPIFLYSNDLNLFTHKKRIHLHISFSMTLLSVLCILARGQVSGLLHWDQLMTTLERLPDICSGMLNELPGVKWLTLRSNTGIKIKG